MRITRAIRVWLAGIRAAVYARLEEIRFRTGVLVLAVVAVVIAVVAVAAVVASGGGTPSPAHRPLAGQARAASPSLLVRPPRGTGPARDAAGLAPRTRRPGPTVRRGAAGRSGGTSYYVAASVAHRTAGAAHEHAAWRPGRRAFGRRGRLPWPRFGGHDSGGQGSGGHHIGGHGFGGHGSGGHRGWGHATRAHHGAAGPRHYGWLRKTRGRRWHAG